MLHGRIVASPYAHARILSVDTSAAEAMGAVVITWDDMPHTCYNERIVTIPSALHRDHYVLADKVRRMGEAVAAVAAETEELAEQRGSGGQGGVRGAAGRDRSRRGDAARRGGDLRHHLARRASRSQIVNNVACERTIVEGDAASGFRGRDVVVEGTVQDPQDLPRAARAEDRRLPAGARRRPDHVGHHAVHPQRPHPARPDLRHPPQQDRRAPHPGRRHLRLQHPDELQPPHLRGAGA